MDKPFVLHLGDCLETLRGLPDNSVDSVVTDPPYGLSFMGKKWDYDVPSTEIWAECLRVLKPGGHLLAFAGTRTQHRMAVRIEDAGFEIRDMIAWVYGSGFPKSMDVSKAIDKARTEDVAPIRAICRVIRAAMDERGMKSRHLVEHFDGCHSRLIDHWAARDTDSQPSLPTWKQWETLRVILGISAEHDAEVWRLNVRKGQSGDTWKNADVIGEHTGQTPGFGEHRFNVRDTTIREASDTARQWQGWGTALKPALEPITVARKPFKATVSANVLAFGTGALNIDGCRVEPTGESRPRSGEASQDQRYTEQGGTNFAAKPGVRGGDPAGRWPANLIHDGSDEVVAMFPETKSGGYPAEGGQRSQVSTFGKPNTRGEQKFTSSEGSASRFFYCAKTSKKDRNEGLSNFETKTADPYGQHRGRRMADNDIRFDGKPASVGQNNHPTVKPTDLMSYLCRLVTPIGGVVLDPFMGSGSTGKAAMREGFKFIGCELDEKYMAIAKARIEHEQAEQSKKQPQLF